MLQNCVQNKDRTKCLKAHSRYALSIVLVTIVLVLVPVGYLCCLGNTAYKEHSCNCLYFINCDTFDCKVTLLDAPHTVDMFKMYITLLCVGGHTSHHNYNTDNKPLA